MSDKQETITVLPQTSGATLCLRFSGEVTAEDFVRNFDDRLKAILEKHDYYNVYLYYDPSFTGWSKEAADLSFKCISKYSPKARRLAYINAPDSRMLMMKMLEPIMNAEIRYFEDDEQQEAMDWVLAYKPQ